MSTIISMSMSTFISMSTGTGMSIIITTTSMEV